jgi:peptidoglycan/LPS O-acetylase OafA/YrhL
MRKSPGVETRLHYLPQLDGLRALALAGVLFFHFRVEGAEQGFLGVDVFFTLSGFIITRKIVSDIDSVSFSFREFYIRRFYRLFPALLAVTTVSLFGTYLTLSPEITKSVSVSSIAAIFSCSNLYFLITTNYFDTSAQYKPLLHTWSLSLEEQFYLIWPLLLWISYRCRHDEVEGEAKFRRLIRAICIAFAISFICHCFCKTFKESMDFYIIITRVYQFALGALCIFAERDNFFQPLAKEILSAIGLSCILASFFVRALSGILEGLIVSVATAAVIMSHGSQISQFFLGNTLSTFIGKVSYSAYLVHWPLWVFFAQVHAALDIGKPGFWQMMILTFSFAVLLNKTVEGPFRKERSSATIAALALITGIALLAGFSGYSSNGWQNRRTGHKPPMKEGNDYLHYCQNERNISSSILSGRCVVGARRPDLKYDGIVIGSSFARHLIGAFNVMSLRNKSYLIIHASNCDFSLKKPPKLGMSKCQKWNSETLKLIKTLPGTYVYFCSMWSKGMISSIPALREYTLSIGHEPVFVSTTPGATSRDGLVFPASACRDLETLPFGKLFHPRCPSSHVVGKAFATTHTDFNQMLRETAENVESVDIFRVFCGNNYITLSGVLRCASSVEENGKSVLLFQKDGFHLTLAGSEKIGRSRLLDRPSFRQRSM